MQRDTAMTRFTPRYNIFHLIGVALIAAGVAVVASVWL